MLGRTSLALLLATAGCRQLFGLQLQSEPDADIPGSDGPTGITCNGDSLETADGQMTACGWGCSTVGGAHCAQLVPSGGGVTSADLQPEPGLTDVTVAGMTIDDKGAIAGGTVSVRAAGTGIIAGIDFHVTNGVAIYRFKDVTFAGAILFSGALPIALVAIGTMTLGAASLDARGSCTNGAAGPGGFAGGAAGHAGGGAGGGSPGSSALGEGAGAGGGGFGGTGGSGASEIGISSIGGAVNGDAAMTTLIGGGGGGGGGGDGVGGGGGGGGGGGALQLASNNAITIGGSINAGGCGGEAAGSDTEGAGGGGAGGALLIEVPTISFASAMLAVNGGGGGGEGVQNGAGQNGLTTRQPADGGMPDGGEGGGGAVQNGGRGLMPSGGGGGAIGRIRFETRTGMLVTTGATLSPSPTDSPTTAVSAIAVTQ